MPEKDVTIVKVAGTTLTAYAVEQPDWTLMDLHMERLGGIEATRLHAGGLSRVVSPSAGAGSPRTRRRDRDGWSVHRPVSHRRQFILPESADAHVVDRAHPGEFADVKDWRTEIYWPLAQ